MFVFNFKYCRLLDVDVGKTKTKMIYIQNQNGVQHSLNTFDVQTVQELLLPIYPKISLPTRVFNLLCNERFNGTKWNATAIPITDESHHLPPWVS